MPLTFVHTSDWHLGRTYERLGPRSTEMRQWRFDAVRRVYDLAVREQAAFILVAGDVFQTDTPRPDVVEQVVALLRDAPRPTIVIPGNHDPLTEGSVWRRDDFGGQLAGVRHVHLALKPEPLELTECNTVVFPSPVTSKICPEDVTSWIPSDPRGGGKYRIGLAHGRWQGYSGEPYHENFIAANRAETAGLDYLALGDFHSYTPADFPAAKARSYYSGAFECTAVDEARPGYALVVKIAEPGAEPNVTPQRVGRMSPTMLPAAVVSPGGGFVALTEQVAAIDQPSDVLLGLQVAGALSQSEMQEFTIWSNSLDDRFLGVDRNFEQLYLEPGEADFEALGLDASEAGVLRLLRNPVGSFTSGAMLADDDRAGTLLQSLGTRDEIRREALALFYRALKQGGGE